MFNNESEQTQAPANNTNGRKRTAMAFINYTVVLKSGAKKKLGSIALDKGNPLHEAIFASVKEDEDNFGKLNIEVNINEVNTTSSEDIKNDLF